MVPHSVPTPVILDRLTIDLDYYESNFNLKALRAYHGLKQLDIVDEVEIFISTSGRGLHFVGLLSDVLEDDERYALRRSLGDDAKRTGLDEERGGRGHATDISWAEKEGNDGEREKMESIEAALLRLERTRAEPLSRAAALAQHGRKGVHDMEGINRPSMARATDERAHGYEESDTVAFLPLLASLGRVAEMHDDPPEER